MTQQTSNKSRLLMNVLTWACLIMTLSFTAFGNTDVFSQETEGLKILVPVGDIEGRGEHWIRLQEKGYIKWNESTQSWDLTDPKFVLIFNGDYARRGPVGIRSAKWILDLKKKYSENVKIATGNHDGNILSFLIMSAELNSGVNEKYTQWLEKNNSADSKSNRLFFWAGQMGLSDKVQNAWLEMVLTDVMNVPQNQLGLRQFDRDAFLIGNNDGKLNLEALNKYLPADEFADKFYNLVRPEGSKNYAWKILENSQIDGSYLGRTKEGKPTLIEFFHSGMSSGDSLGTIPGVGGRYVKVKRDTKMLTGLSYNGEQMNPDRPDHQKFFLAWQADLDEVFKKQQLLELKNILKDVAQLNVQIKKNPTEEKLQTHRADLLKYARTLELPHYLDAKWSEVTGMYYRSGSRIYPDPKLVEENSLPAIPDKNIIAAEARIGITIKVGGHKPVGDVATLMVGFDDKTGKIVLHVFHDTSYSPVEGNNDIHILEDGSVKISGQTRDGINMLMEYPSQEILSKWEKLAEKYEGVDPKSIPGDDAIRIERVSQYKNIGKVMGGRLIIGFVQNRDSEGKLVTDYNNYLTVRQEGRNYIYQKIDIWGVQEFIKTGGRLEYAQSDLEKMLKKEELRKINMLRNDLGKTVHTLDHVKKSLAGESVYVLSGPADASFSQVMNPGGNKDYVVNHYLKAFRAELENIPADKKVTFLTGGTTGLEAVLSKIIADVNAEREANGKRVFKIYGNITLVAGGGEIDPSIKDFLVLPKTFYWDDYFKNMMETLVLKSDAAEINIRFGGGGGIVGSQIDQAIRFAQKDRRVKITLDQGITIEPKNTTHKKRGATDKFIDELEKQKLAYPFLSVLKAQGSRFHLASGAPSQSVTWTSNISPTTNTRTSSVAMCRSFYGR